MRQKHCENQTERPDETPGEVVWIEEEVVWMKEGDNLANLKRLDGGVERSQVGMSHYVM